MYFKAKTDFVLVFHHGAVEGYLQNPDFLKEKLKLFNCLEANRPASNEVNTTYVTHSVFLFLLLFYSIYLRLLGVIPFEDQSKNL